MTQPLVSELICSLATHGFVEVSDLSTTIPDGNILLKRQTWNTNRAVVFVSPPSVPEDFSSYVRSLRKRVAFRCGFIPFFWGIGIQIIIMAPGLAETEIDPKKHIALVDNQWAIIQSIFLVDSAARTFLSARTWGQVVTGTFQDAIADVLTRHYGRQER